MDNEPRNCLTCKHLTSSYLQERIARRDRFIDLCCSLLPGVLALMPRSGKLFRGREEIKECPAWLG
jgi:hypothetical protein